MRALGERARGRRVADQQAHHTHPPVVWAAVYLSAAGGDNSEVSPLVMAR